MSLHLLNKIMNKPPSDPVVNYLYSIQFFTDNLYSPLELNDVDQTDKIAIKIDLPEFDVSYVTRKFLGQEKSFPIYRKNSGDTTLEFYMHSDVSENKFCYAFFKHLYEEYKHNEFDYLFNKIEVKLHSKENTTKLGTDEFLYKYTYMNCIVTKITQGSLSYDSGELLKYSMSIHFDDWTVNTSNAIE